MKLIHTIYATNVTELVTWRKNDDTLFYDVGDYRIYWLQFNSTSFLLLNHMPCNKLRILNTGYNLENQGEIK